MDYQILKVNHSKTLDSSATSCQQDEQLELEEEWDDTPTAMQLRAIFTLVAGALLLIAGVVGGVIWAWRGGELTLTHLVFAPAVTPPRWVTVLALALGAGAASSAPKPLRELIRKYSAAAWKGTSSLLLTFAAALLVVAWAQGPLRDALGSDEGWRQGVAALAVAALPLALLFVVFLPGRPAKT